MFNWSFVGVRYRLRVFYICQYVSFLLLFCGGCFSYVLLQGWGYNCESLWYSQWMFVQFRSFLVGWSVLSVWLSFVGLCVSRQFIGLWVGFVGMGCFFFLCGGFGWFLMFWQVGLGLFKRRFSVFRSVSRNIRGVLRRRLRVGIILYVVYVFG